MGRQVGMADGRWTRTDEAAALNVDQGGDLEQSTRSMGFIESAIVFSFFSFLFFSILLSSIPSSPVSRSIGASSSFSSSSTTELKPSIFLPAHAPL